MKKFLALFLALMLLVSLCGCSGLAQKAPAEEESTPVEGPDATVQNDMAVVEDPAEKYMGTWVSTSQPIGGNAVHSIRLLPSGKAIWSYYGNDGTGVLVTEEDTATSGEWELDEDRILVYYSYAVGLGNGVMIFDILTEKTLSMGQTTYLREE